MCEQGEINGEALLENVEDEQETDSMEGELPENNEQRENLGEKEATGRKSPSSLVKSVR